RDHVAEDEVGLGQVPVARDLGSGGEFGAFGEVVHPAHQSRTRPNPRLAELEAVVRRREAIDERQDLAAARVDSQEPRRALEAAVRKVDEQPVNPPAAGIQGPANRVADPYHPASMPAPRGPLRLHALPALTPPPHDRGRAPPAAISPPRP